MQAILTATRLRSLSLVALLAAASVAIWPSWSALLQNWRGTADYSYAYLLAPLIACWIVVRSADVPAPSVRMSPLAFIALLLALAAWLVAYKAASAIGEELTIPIVLWCALWTAFGLPVARSLGAPLACLYLTIPVWDFLIPWLQRIAVFITETVFGWGGIPVHVEGVRVYIPEGTFTIAEGCAGRRYFIICLSVAALLAGVLRMPPRKALAFLGLSALMALAANWVRILIVIYAGHITNMTSYLVAKEHLSLGWALFAVLIALVCMIGLRLAGPDASGRRPGQQRQTARNSPDGVRDVLRRPAPVVTLVLLSIPLIGIHYSRTAFASSAAKPHEQLSLPSAAGPWRGPQDPDSQWTPKYEGTSRARRAAYVSSTESTVQVFIAEYEGATRGAKLISSTNSVLGPGWEAIKTERLGASSGGQRAQGATAIWASTPGGARWLISYWYEVDGFTTTSPIAAQLAYGVLAWKAPVRSRVVAAATLCQTDCDEERTSLRDFWRSIGYRLL